MKDIPSKVGERPAESRESWVGEEPGAWGRGHGACQVDWPAVLKLFDLRTLLYS